MKKSQKKNLTSETKIFTSSIFKSPRFGSTVRIAFSIFGLTMMILLTVETSRAQQFCNATPITIPTSGSSNPYPSTINVSGINGTISGMSVTLNNIQHAFANDIDILLVGPQGQKFIILSDAGGDAGFRNTPTTITLSDAGAALVPNSIGTAVPPGTYKPTNYGSTADTFPGVAAPYSSPATAGSATFASVFNTTNPNGDWKLYVVDDGADPGGSIGSGWCLNLTIIASNPGQLQLDAPAYTFDEKDGTKQITVTRTNGTAGAVTVNYATSNGTATGGASCSTAGVDYINASGTLTFPDGVTSQTFPITFCNDAVDEPEETINITLSNPTGGATLGTPSAAVITLVRVERFCAGTSITIPSNSGPANPYPSSVNVSGLTGSLSNVSVTLTNISHEQANDIDILLVGPQGQKFVILSDAGNRFGFFNPVTLTLSDAGLMNIPADNTGMIPAGTYKPTNYGQGDTFPAPAPPAPYEFPAPDGNQTFASVFGGTNPNGEWKLYVFDDLNSSGGSIAGGWCLNISTVQATPGQFQFGASSYTFQENHLNAVIGVRRTGGNAGAVSVNYATSNGTAVGGSSCATGIDYINTSGTISFADGETGEKTFIVQLCRDSQFKSAVETVNLLLSNPTGGAVLGSPSAATLNIESSAPSRFSFPLDFNSTSDFQTQQVLIRIQRDNLSDLPVTDSVTYTTGGGTATGGASCSTAGVDYITTTGTVTLAPNVNFQDVPVTICVDAVAEQIEFFELTLSNPSPGADINPSRMTTRVVIVDNQPTVYVVNTTSDVNDGICDATRCTLFEAVLAANAGPGADEIRFDPAFFNQPRTIDLEDPIQIRQNVSIIGTGTNFVRLNPTFAPVVFQTSANVNIRDLTITAFGGTGDGIFNTGTLNLTNVVLSRMDTGDDGIIINDGGTLTMTNCSVIDNFGSQGGVNNRRGGIFNIVSSVIARNKGDLRGGGVRNESGTVNITNSTISGNVTSNAGGIYNLAGTININHSTIYGNSQDQNLASPKVGGIFNESGATVNIKNSIVAGNLHSTTVPSDLNGAFVSQGNNLIGTTDNSTGITNNINGDKAGTNAAPLNAMLAPLADNGGLTLTHALLTGSPAIDAANPASDLTTDQRGFRRPFDGDGNGSAVSDMGAFELGALAPAGRTAFDFDGDGRADLSVFRPGEGRWYINRSSNNQLAAAQFGLSNDKLVPADYDGDGRTDLAVYRDGAWHISNSSNAQLRSVNFGLAGDLPVPGDFDGDGRADIAVFRPSDGTWYRLNSSNGQFVAAQFGLSGDVPVIGDFNGDGKSDLTVFRPSNGFWYIARTTGTPAQNFDAIKFGQNGDQTVAADYDGDGKTDIAVYRPADGNWYLLRSSNGQMRIERFGLSNDRPVPADYDGDGKADIAVYRGSGEWYLLRSTAGFGAFNFGLASDKPVPNSYVIIQ